MSILKSKSGLQMWHGADGTWNTNTDVCPQPMHYGNNVYYKQYFCPSNDKYNSLDSDEVQVSSICAIHQPLSNAWDPPSRVHTHVTVSCILKNMINVFVVLENINKSHEKINTDKKDNTQSRQRLHICKYYWLFWFQYCMYAYDQRSQTEWKKKSEKQFLYLTNME